MIYNTFDELVLILYQLLLVVMIVGFRMKYV